MHQVIYNAEQVHTYVRNYAVTLSNNLDAVNLMNRQNLSIYEQLSSMRALDLMLKSNPYIGSFYVYSGQEDMYYIIGSNPLIRRGSDFDPWAATILKKGSTFPKLAPIPRRMPLSETNPEQTILNQLTLGSFDTLDNKSFWFVSRNVGVMAHTDPKQFLTNAAEIIVGFASDRIPPNKKEGEWLHEYGITLDPGMPVAVAVMKIDHYSEFCERYKQSDRALLRHALTNITGEIMSEFHT